MFINLSKLKTCISCPFPNKTKLKLDFHVLIGLKNSTKVKDTAMPRAMLALLTYLKLLTLFTLLKLLTFLLQWQVPTTNAIWLERFKNIVHGLWEFYVVCVVNGIIPLRLLRLLEDLWWK